MGFAKLIAHRIHFFYRRNIVCEHYPMLTMISREEWKEKGALGVIYMLHHIKEKNPYGIPTNEDLKVSPAFLEDIIIKYKKQGFSFISLDQLHEIISSDIKPKNPFIAFTLDDGYLDNYTQAFPIFERHKVPFAIFVATDFIDKRTILWWDILEEIILNHKSIIADCKEYSCETRQEKWDVFRILREKILNFDQANLKENLNVLFSHYDIDVYKPIQLQAMSWEQIKDISQHPLCTIGGHTVSHLALNLLDEDQIRQEVTEGIIKLQDITGKPINHFAYPYGSPNVVGEREFKIISELGFQTAFTSYGGCITNRNKHQITSLPRVYLHER